MRLEVSTNLKVIQDFPRWISEGKAAAFLNYVPSAFKKLHSVFEIEYLSPIKMACLEDLERLFALSCVTDLSSGHSFVIDVCLVHKPPIM